MAIANLGMGISLEVDDLAAGAKLENFEKTFSQMEASVAQDTKSFGLSMGAAAAGAAIMGAGIAGLASLRAPLQSTKAFGAAIAEVTTEVDEATFSQKQMHDIGLDLAGQFGKFPVEEAKGLYQAVAAGANTASTATNLMTRANQLAIGGVTDVSTAIDGITTALNAYGMAYTDQNIVGVSDAFFVAMADGKTKVGDLAAQIGRVAPSAKALGISFDEVLASVSAMTGQGLKAEMAITGMHGALANIVKPSSDATAEASRLGIKFSQTELRAKGWKVFLDQITSSSRYNANSLSKLFTSVEGLNAIQALTADGSKKFNAILADMGTKSGRTQNAFDKMANTLDFADDKFEALKEVASVLIGEALEPAAKSVLRFGSRVLEVFNKIPAPVREFLTKAFAVSSVLLVIVGGAIAAAGAAGMLSTGLSALGISFGGVLAVAAPVVLALGALALGALAFQQIIDSNIGGLGDRFHAAIGKISLAWRALSQLFEQGGFSGDVLKELNAGGGDVESFAIRVYLAVNRVKAFWDGLVAGFKSGLDRAAPIFDSFVAAIDRLEKAFGFADEIDTAKMGNDFAESGSKGEAVGKKLADVIERVTKALTYAVDETTAFVKEWDKVDTSDASTGFKELADSLKDLGRTLDLLLPSSDSAEKDLTAGAVAARLLGVAITWTKTQIEGLFQAFSGFGMTFRGVINVVGGIINGEWSRIWLGMKEIMMGTLQGLLAPFLGIIGKILAAIDAVGKLGGKNLGLGKGFQDFRDAVDAGTRHTVFGSNEQEGNPLLRSSAGRAVDAARGSSRLGVFADAEAPVGSMFGPAQQTAFPAGAAQAQADAAAGGTAGATTALAEAARTFAQQKSGPVALTGNIYLDSVAVGTIVAAGQAGEASRAGTPVAVVPQ